MWSGAASRGCPCTASLVVAVVVVGRVVSHQCSSRSMTHREAARELEHGWQMTTGIWSWGGGGAWVRGSQWNKNASEWRKKKQQLSIHQELAHTPLIGCHCKFTILTQLQEITDHKALRNISHSNETLLSKNPVRGTAHIQRVSVVNLHKQTAGDGAGNRNQPILQPRYISVSALTSLSRCVVGHDVTNQYWAHFLCQSPYKIQCFIYKTLCRVRPLTQFLVPQPSLASYYLT